MFPLSHLLRRFVQNGSLRVIDAGGKTHEFTGGPGPKVAIRMHTRMLPFKLFLNPELTAGEAYMDGTLTFEDCTLRDFLHLFSVNRLSLGKYPLQAALRGLWRRLKSFQQYNPMGTAQKNAAHHYDLSRRLYELFLDTDLQYTCAVFENPGETLEQAQVNKNRLVASKLCLKPGQRIFEIGSGWGGLAIYLATVADVDVTGVTLSHEQHAVACERVKALGLQDRVRFLIKDYRDVTERFDRVVAVGMFEHVGAPHYGEFFTKIRDRLNDDGVALVHAIGRMGPPGTTGPFIRKYIYPGGYTPALSEVLEQTQQQRLWVTDVEILRLHYVETLREWNARFQANRAEVAALYDERFCRMWEFYLIACEMAFAHGGAMVFQMQLARDRHAVPLTRGYLFDAQRRLRERDTNLATRRAA